MYDHFWSFVLAGSISHHSTIKELVNLRNSSYRTNHSEFLCRSGWSKLAVMQQIALNLLCSLLQKKDCYLFFIIDDPQILKQTKEMDAIGKLFHQASGRYSTVLHLVDCAYACLSHLGIQAQRAQGRTEKNCKVLRLEAFGKRKASLR